MSEEPPTDDIHSPAGATVENLKFVLQDTRVLLLQQILAHQTSALSVEELDYRNPDLSEENIRYHLRKMEERGIVQGRKIPKGNRKQNLPNTFFTVTSKGANLLEHANLFEEIRIWSEIYDRMERTERIIEIERMDSRPNPSGESAIESTKSLDASPKHEGLQLLTIGVGNAGSKIVDKMVEFEQLTNRNLCRHVLVINTSRTDLAKPDHVTEDRRILIGDTHQKAKGHGVGGDVDVGVEVAKNDLGEIRRAFDDLEIHEVDAILVAASLGGGTGSGAGPVVIKELQRIYDEPVYGLGILPGKYEGGRPALNAAQSLQWFVNETDNFIAFDNDAWRSKRQSIEQGYERMNRELATRIVTLLGAGGYDESKVAENAMDSRDIIRTLDAGGISSIGYAATRVDKSKSGYLSRFRGDHQVEQGATSAVKINELVRRAVNSRLTLPCRVASANRAMIVISGPPSELSRKGLESAREWIEREADTVEVLAGADPRENATALSAVVLLSNVTDAPRINSIQDQATEALDKIAELESNLEASIDDLLPESDAHDHLFER